MVVKLRCFNCNTKYLVEKQTLHHVYKALINNKIGDVISASKLHRLKMWHIKALRIANCLL